MYRTRTVEGRYYVGVFDCTVITVYTGRKLKRVLFRYKEFPL